MCVRAGRDIPMARRWTLFRRPRGVVGRASVGGGVGDDARTAVALATVSKAAGGGACVHTAAVADAGTALAAKPAADENREEGVAIIVVAAEADGARASVGRPAGPSSSATAGPSTYTHAPACSEIATADVSFFWGGRKTMYRRRGGGGVGHTACACGRARPTAVVPAIGPTQQPRRRTGR
jgi:hypothetical protein